MSQVEDGVSPESRSDAVAAAASAVRRGEIVVLPTDTVYGVGCDAFDAEAVATLLAVKGRGRALPPPVLIPTSRTAIGLAAEIPDYATTLMAHFWPGPLTLVLKAHTTLHWDLGDTNGTVALRVPDHELALDLLGEIGPMAVTSANRTGEAAAHTVEEACAMLGDDVGVYLDGGPSSGGPASTIVDCTGESPITLRLGALAQDRIDAVLAPEPDETSEAADPGRGPADPSDDPLPGQEPDPRPTGG